MALVPYEGQDDDADAFIVTSYKDGDLILKHHLEEAVQRQQEMIYWAREHVVDDVVLYRGFQILEAATQYTDENVRNFAMKILQEAQNSTNQLVFNTANEVIASFDDFRQQLYNELSSFSAYVDAQHQEVRQEVQRIKSNVQSETQRLQAHVSAESERVKLEAASAALSLTSAAESRAVETVTRSTAASAKQIETVRNLLVSEIDSVRKTVEEMEGRRVVTAESVEDAVRRLKRAEEAAANAAQRMRNLASTKAVDELEKKVDELRTAMRPLSDFVESNRELVQETQKQREEMRLIVAEIQTLHRRSEEISEKMKLATQKNATKEDLQAAINNIAAGHRQQRSSQAQAGDNASHMLNHALRNEIAQLAAKVDQATLIIGLLHFPTEDLEELNLADRINALKTLAEHKARQAQPPPLQAATARFEPITPQQPRPQSVTSRFEPIIPAQTLRQAQPSPAPTRPKQHEVIDLTREEHNSEPGDITATSFQQRATNTAQQATQKADEGPRYATTTRPHRRDADDDFELVMRTPIPMNQQRPGNHAAIANAEPRPSTAFKTEVIPSNTQHDDPFSDVVPVSQMKTLQRAQTAETERRKQNADQDGSHQDEDFIATVRKHSRARKDSDEESEVSAATDREDIQSVAKSVGRTADQELKIHQSDVHMTLITFGKLKLDDYVNRWRDRFRKYVRTTKDQAELDQLLQRFASSHQMMTTATRSKNIMTIYNTMELHITCLAEAMRHELRCLHAAGFIIDAVEKQVQRATNSKRHKAFDYEEVLDRTARMTAPKMGHHVQNFSRGRGGRGRGNRWTPQYQALPGLQSYQPYYNQHTQYDSQYQPQQFQQTTFPATAFPPRRGGYRR